MARRGSRRGRGVGGPSLPGFTVQRMVIEGDSITSTTPSTYASSFYSYRYDDSRPDLFVEVRAQASRVVGQAGNLNDDGNSLMGNVAEDAAYTPDLVTIMIGANDMAASRTGAQHMTDLMGYYSAVKAARPTARLAWSPPLPYNLNQSHPNYLNFTAQRAIVIADCRNPAVWGQWADYFLPMGFHPDFNDAGLAPSLYGDGVHPSTAGQTLVLASYTASANSIADASRVNATTPYGSVWPVSETSLSASTDIVRRFILSGLAHTGVASGITVSGGDAQVRLNGGAYGTSTGRVYNGDVIDVRRTTSASPLTAVTYDLTIGSETRTISLTTVASVTPVALSNPGTASSGPPSAAISLPNLTFGAGVAVVGITCYSSGSLTSVPTQLTLTPVGGGTAITLTLRQSGGRAVSRAFAVYTATVTAGSYDLTGTRPNAAVCTWASYCTLENADPVPTSAPAFTSVVSESDPHLATSVTVPANGIQLGWLMKENGTAGSAGAGSTLVNTGNVTDAGSGNIAGLVAVQRGTTGQAAMNTGFGHFGRGAMAFKALGT